MPLVLRKGRRHAMVWEPSRVPVTLPNRRNARHHNSYQKEIEKIGPRWCNNFAPLLLLQQPEGIDNKEPLDNDTAQVRLCSEEVRVTIKEWRLTHSN